MQNIKIWDKVEVCDIGDWDEWDGGWYFIWTVEWKHICTPEEKNIINFLSCDSYMGNFAPFDYVRPAQIWLEQKLPAQWDMIEVRDKHSGYEQKWQWGKIFVCEYKGRILTHPEWATTFSLWDEWRFPQEEVTLSDGNTYLVEESDGQKILKPKQ